MIKSLFRKLKLVLKDHKSEQDAQRLQEWPIPPQLYFPLWLKHGGDLNPEVEIGQTVLAGQRLAYNPDTRAAIYASSSGQVQTIVDNPIAHPSKLQVKTIVLQTDGNDQWLAHMRTGETGNPCPEIFWQQLAQAGLLGLGGAAFPSLRKWTDQPIHTLIINAVECEPYINCDHALILRTADRLVDILQCLQTQLNAKRAIIAIEANKPKAIALLQACTKSLNIEIAIRPVSYPNGAAKILIQALTGTQIPPGKHASDYGILCYNVGTLYAMWEAYFLNKPLTHRITTLAGDALEQAINVDLRFGTPLSFVLAQLKLDRNAALRISQGGNMMGLQIDQMEIPVQAESNCFLIQKTIQAPRHQYPCINCGRCAEACPETLHPQQLHRFAQSQQFAAAETASIDKCISCGICDAVCPSNIPLTESFVALKAAIRHERHQSHSRTAAKARFEAREVRLEKLAAKQAEKRRLKREKLAQKSEQAATQAPDKKAAIMAAVARARAKKLTTD